MTDKSSRPGLGHLMGNWGRTAAKPLRTSTHRCEAGHPMDPKWTFCPYCKAASGAGERTRADSMAPGSAPPDPGPRASMGVTRINTAAGESPDYTDVPDEPFTNLPELDPDPRPRPASAGHTKVFTEADSSPPAGAAMQRGRTAVLEVERFGNSAQRRPTAGRRLRGIVVTYTWSPLGELYEVHEGRNFAGSGQIAAEGHRDADVLVADPAMSSTHFLILCQGGQYRISDCNSTNGTYVNGRLIDPLGIELADDALIRAGDTLMVFKKLTPPEARPHSPDDLA